MATDVKKLIAAINPELYCDDTRDEGGVKLSEAVKKIAKKEGYLKAAEKAKLRETDFIDIQYVQLTKNAFSLSGFKSPIEKHSMEYDASSQALEPVYFWILDYVRRAYEEAEKLADNFFSSPGSGHFSEMSKRATVMQEEAMKIFGTTNTLIKSILNIIYDLKEFKVRLALYDDLKSGEDNKRNAALLALKQIWLDNVDTKKQVSSIYNLARQFDYVTLIDGFMAAESLEKLDKIDLNERVKRILQQRLAEFEFWLRESEQELRKRYQVERIYLRSQVNSLKLYARWAKPYLRAAKELEQSLEPTADIVNAFNTAIFQLVLLAKGKYDPKEDVAKGELPKMFNTIKTRKYFPIAIIEFGFRSIPDRSDQRGGYSFRGKVNTGFTSFVLNEDELSALKKTLEEDDFDDMYRTIAGATTESLEQIKEDLDEFLYEDKKKEKKEEKEEEDTNPFSALFSFFKGEKKEEEKDLSKGIEPDNEYEKVIRSQAILSAREKCRRLYDTYKKVHGMPAFPPSIY
ncbi:hypothetical protein HYV50_00175 [Candidatus Pacearchaeota archaeon]|nr:hypothetical protein [Candidatus Pacearchaeota archaeon]